MGDFDQDYPAAGVQSLRCDVELRDLGPAKFRTGGTKGGMKLFCGEWAKFGEDMGELELLACPKCRHVEFRLPKE